MIPEAKTMADRIILKKEQERGRRLSKEEKQFIYKKANEIVKRDQKQESKQAKREQKKNSKGLRKWPKLVAILTALGITSVFGQKLLEAPKDPQPIVTEDDKSKETESFKDKYVVTPEEMDQYKPVYEKSDIEKAVDQLKDGEDVKVFLEDMYIEQYEEITGETIETVEFDFENWQDYVYENAEYVVTHGENPDAVKSMLDDYKIKENVNVLEVKTADDGETIDAATMMSIDGKYSAVKVIDGDKMEDYVSVLANSNDENLANIIIKGLQYAEKMEDKDQKESAKKQFIQELEEADKGSQQKSNEGYEIGD